MTRTRPVREAGARAARTAVRVAVVGLTLLPFVSAAALAVPTGLPGGPIPFPRVVGSAPGQEDAARPTAAGDDRAVPDGDAEALPADAVPPELEREVRALEEAVERERAALAAERAAGELELEALAERLVAAELERQALAASAPAAERAAEEARLDAARSATELAAIERATAELAAVLEVHARELPGGADHVERAVRVARLLDAGRRVEAHREVLELFGELDRRAASVTLEERTLRTADGALETVELLSIGHVACAYRAGGRVGLALGAPRDASGFRWREELPPEVAAGWARAFDLARRATAGQRGASLAALLRLEAPLDVTGELRAGSTLGALEPLERLERGGPVMWPLLAVGLTCVLLLLERTLELYGRNRLAADLGRRVAEALRAGDEQGALALAHGARGAVGRTVAAVLDARGRGREMLENRIQEAVLLEVPRLRRALRGIAVLAAIAPLLGLLGTITGIIETFAVLETVGQGDPGLMAGGISEALLTTATGLVIAIPVLLLHGLLSGRVESLVAAAEGQSVLVANALELTAEEAA